MKRCSMRGNSPSPTPILSNKIMDVKVEYELGLNPDDPTVRSTRTCLITENVASSPRKTDSPQLLPPVANQQIVQPHTQRIRLTV
jgi:hypothetical protein